MQGDADDDGAVVIGTGESGGNRNQAERGALDGAGKVDPPDRMERVRARASGYIAGADFTRRGTAGVGLLDFAQGVGRCDDVCLGAVGDSVQVGGQARRHREVQLAEVLVAVFAVQLQGEGGKAACGGVGGAGFEGRFEGADLTGTGAAVRAGFKAEDLGGFHRRQGFVPGDEGGIDGVDRAGGGSRHQGTFTTEEMQLEIVEGRLGQFFEVGGQLAGFGVRFE